jgi:hypothetical protein
MGIRRNRRFHPVQQHLLHFQLRHSAAVAATVAYGDEH